MSQLKFLNLQNNLIDNEESLNYLKPLEKLRFVWFSGNPLSYRKHYKEAI